MRRKGKRLREELKTPSSSKGKANRMKLQTGARPFRDLQTPNNDNSLKLNMPSCMRACCVNAEAKHKKHLRCKTCDRNSKLCECEKQMKECLMKIFNSKFNQILITSGFPLGGKLRTLQEKLAGSNESSVMEIAKEAKQVYNSVTTTFSFAKDNEEFGEEIIQKIYGTEFAVNELFEVAEILEKRMESLLEDYEANPTSSSSILDTVWKHLKKQFPLHDLSDQRGKFEKVIKNILEAQPAPENVDALDIANKVFDEVLAIGLNNIDENETNSTPGMEVEEFPLAAPEEGKFHDFECPGINHYYVATSQYYKMLLQPHQTQFPKPIQNKANSVQSVEHISNPKTLEKYNARKQAFKEAGKVNTEKKVHEMLLFHGTDAANIDSILKDGFNANFNPSHKSKTQHYGRGIYVAEHPEMAFHYGNIILLCKVGNTSHFLPLPFVLDPGGAWNNGEEDIFAPGCSRRGAGGHS